MGGQTDFVIRTEDLRHDEILDLFVPTERDEQLLELMKSPTPLVIEGSRGTGKTLLLRVCEQQLLGRFDQDKVFPIYLSFVKGSLINTSDPQQFQHWMLARLSSRIIRSLRQKGFLASPSAAACVLAGGDLKKVGDASAFETLAIRYEELYKKPGIEIADLNLPDVEIFRDAIQDLCNDLGIRRFNIIFDEVAHIFKPEQQRQFFTMFRDLRCPYITCNAAVYPGVTSYGTFEATHDARTESLHRDVRGPSYREQMREIVFKQATSNLQSDIERNGKNFDALAYAANGNPRLLLKIVARSGRLRSAEVNAVLKEFFRDEIWSEHSNLAEKYSGHRELIDWGRELHPRHCNP